jgi:hypothetical protein
MEFISKIEDDESKDNAQKNLEFSYDRSLESLSTDSGAESQDSVQSSKEVSTLHYL